MRNDLQQTLIDRGTIAQRVRELARQITADLAAEEHDGEITLIPVLTGSIIFVADLIRELPQRMKIHLISASSYPGTATTSQGVKIQETLSNVPDDLTGRYVLVLDDILDSGQTLRAVTRELNTRNPQALKTCVLLRKRRTETVDFPLDYAAFDIPDEFVVGYGLDYDGYYRNLPHLGVLNKDALEQHA
ncbi:MAG: hypoxanthine phosphoribosyltransferase [Planctomycetota bacterium]